MIYPNANDLVSFIEVSQTKNLSRAAERLGMTQPALSQAMKRLEDSFGQQLLIRGKGGVTLSRAGEKLVLKSREFLDHWENLVNDANRDRYEVKGLYHFGVHTSVALYTMPLLMPHMLTEFPHLELRFMHDLSRLVTDEVIAFKLDFALAINPIAHPELVIQELFTDHVHFWRSKKLNFCNDLEGENNVLIRDPNLIQSEDLLRCLKKKVSFSRQVTSSNLELIRDLTLSGAGIGIIPERVVGKESAKLEKLKALPSFKDRLCLIYRADAQMPEAGRKLTKFIKSKLR